MNSFVKARAAPVRSIEELSPEEMLAISGGGSGCKGQTCNTYCDGPNCWTMCTCDRMDA